jgi:hypothetical protein
LPDDGFGELECTTNVSARIPPCAHRLPVD